MYLCSFPFETGVLVYEVFIDDNFYTKDEKTEKRNVTYVWYKMEMMLREK